MIREEVPLKSLRNNSQQRERIDIDSLRDIEDDTFSREQAEDVSFLNGLMQDIIGTSMGVASAVDPALRITSFSRDKEPNTRFGNALNAFISGGSEFFQRAMTDGIAGVLKTAREYNPGEVVKDILTGDRIGGDDEMNTVERAFYNMGRELDGELQRLFPENEEYRGEFISSTIPRMAGTLTGQLSTLGAGTALGASAGAASSISAAVTGISFSGSEFDRAYEQTGDANLATKAFIANLPINSLGTKLQLATFTNRLNKLTGGGVTKYLLKGFKNKYIGITGTPATATIAGGFEEGVTEIAQEFMTNLAARNIYDEGRSLVEGLAEVGLPAFVMGAVLNGVSVGTALQRQKGLDAHERASVSQMERFAKSQKEELGLATNQLDIDKLRDRKAEGRQKVPSDAPHITESSALAFDASGFKNKAAKKFKGIYDEWIRPRGNFPTKIYDRLLDKDNQRAKDTQEMIFRTRNLESAIKEDFGIKGDIYDPSIFPQDTMNTINDALQGKQDALDKLPQKTHDAVVKMRDHIDRISKDLLDSNFVSGDLQASIESNLGSYIHRSYRIFGDERVRNNWIKNVPESVVNNAKKFIRDTYKARGVKLTESTLNKRINQILYDKSMPLYFISQIKDKRKDLHTVYIDSDVIKQRQNIPQPIRALMGEVVSPFSNYVKTITKMSETLHEAVFFEDLVGKYTRGNNSFFSDSFDMGKGHTDRVSPQVGGLDLSDKYIYTTPEIAKALEDVYKTDTHGNLFKYYMTTNAVTKYAKTTLNITTHGRNLIGGAMMALNAGHIPGSGHYRGALRTVANTFKVDLNADAEQKILRYKELGLLDKDVRAGELTDIMKDIEINENAFLGDNFDHLKAKGNKFYRSAKWGADVMTKVYQAEDNLIRVAFFEAELARYRKADPDISEEYVARIVRDTYQDYSQVGKAAKLIRRFPLVGPFVAFPHEVIRTSVNNAMQAKRELRSGNSGIRKIGAQRAAGMIAAGVGTTVLSMATRHMFGVSEQEDEDARKFDAPWNARAEKLYIGKDEKGRLQSISLSYIDPYAIIKEPVLELLFRDRHDSFQEKFVSAMSSLFEPVINPEILAQKLTEIATNKKQVGGRVFNPQDTLGGQAGDMFAHLWDGFEPGTLTQAKNIIDSIDESEKTEWEKKRKPSEELLALFGLRVVTTDPKRAIKFDTMDFRSAITDIRQFTADISFEDILKRENRDVVEQSVNREIEVMRDMSDKIRAAYRLGVDRSEILKSVKEAGMSEKQFEELEAGLFLPRTEQEMFMLKFEQEMKSLGL